MAVVRSLTRLLICLATWQLTLQSWLFVQRKGTPLVIHLETNDDVSMTSAAFASAGNALLPVKDNQVQEKNQTQMLLGFIRVQKTGSTSMLSFLGSTLSSWDNYIYSRTAYVNTLPKQGQSNAVPFCIYGRIDREAFEISHDPKDDPNPFSVLQKGHPEWTCCHMKQGGIYKTWNQSLEHVHSQWNHRRFQLQLFGMIRDPLDRLQSLFYYVQRQDCGGGYHWKSMFSPEQYECICDDNMEGFLHHLANSSRVYGLGIPNQHVFFGESLKDAIATLREDPSDEPEVSTNSNRGAAVIVLVHECFEESLLYLEHSYPQLFEPGAARGFMESKNYRVNVRPHKTHANNTNTQSLRKKAEAWFQNDYKFYNEAVQEFRRRLEVANVPQSNTCHTKLQKSRT